MFKVLIIGAGSIGNHLSYACRQKGWEVCLYDVDPEAIERTRCQIFPARYGEWDENILCVTDFPINQDYDLVIVGSPPGTHIELALECLRRYTPSVLMIEKPLCAPFEKRLAEFRSVLEESNTVAVVGYNHHLTPNTKFAEELLNDDFVGEPLAMHVSWQEHWGGIFQAHPWLSGPKDSYLGFWERGGGACSEHSHGIAIWLYFSDILGLGNVTDVRAMQKFCETPDFFYDESTCLSIKSERGLIGTVIQDVVTKPAKKSLRIQGEKGFIEWYANYDNECDAVIYGSDEVIHEQRFPKTRIDDFAPEIDHIDLLLQKKTEAVSSPIRLEIGLRCTEVISLSFESVGRRSEHI